MNSYNELESLFRRAANSVIKAGCSQFILSTVVGDPCIGWAKDYDIKVIVNSKPGIFSQINAMLPHIKQPFVCYSSSNDVTLPNKLKIESGMLSATGKKVCYSAFYDENEATGRRSVRKMRPYSYKLHQAGNYVSDCAMVDTAVFLKYTPFREQYKNFAYYDLWLRIYKGEGNVFIYNPDPTWVYYISPRSQHVKRLKNPKAHHANNMMRAKLKRDHRL